MKHLGRYLDESVYKFNQRRNAEVFDTTVSRMVNTDPLSFEELTASE